MTVSHNQSRDEQTVAIQTQKAMKMISRITIAAASFWIVCSFAWLFFVVCTSQIAQEPYSGVVWPLTIHSVCYLFDWNHHKNNIIPLKMKNESCVRCKSSDCALLFHYWSFGDDLPVTNLCISIIIFTAAVFWFFVLSFWPFDMS